MKKILIAEDNKDKREALVNVLSADYEVLEVENGKEAIEAVEKQGEELSLILLNLVMPVMDGCAFLEDYKTKIALPRIPVVIMTSLSEPEYEIKCFELGALDFIKEPYNAQVIKKRVEKIIAMNEAASIPEDFEYDPVLNIYTRGIFFAKVAGVLRTNLNVAYDVVCFEIEGYHLMLDRYGNAKCKEFQKKVFKDIFKALPDNAILGKLESSQVAALIPHQEESFYKLILKETLINIVKDGSTNTVNGIVKGGVYENVEHRLPVETICSNAMMAISSIHEHYGVYLVRYDNSLREKISKKQFILENMAKALEEHEFTAYYQPKYNILQEKVGGAEALVRWIHPEKGMMNPGEFIPVFEQNGFISELDRYMLETVCCDLKRWMAEGKEVVPVSINVSQVDFDNRNLAEEYTKIVDDYGIDHSLIHFEITESANATDAEKKKYNVIKFREKGFLIELDDFGAGYASLSSLSDLPIDVLKLDMSLIKKMFERKHSAVLSGALYTVRELELKVVAEGVETKEQIQELKWKGAYIDDLYIQGYYFSKPLPAKDFEKFITKEEALSESPDNIKMNVEYETFNSEEYSKMNENYSKDQLLRKYKAFVEQAGVVIYEYDPYSDRMVLETWQESGEIRKRSADNYLENLPKTNWIENRYVESYIETLKRVSQSGMPGSVDVRAMFAGGAYGLCRYHFTAIKDKDGNVERVIGRAYVLEYSDGSEIIDNIPVYIFRYDPDTYELDYISSSVVDFLDFGGKEEFRRFYNNSFVNMIYEKDKKRILDKISDEESNPDTKMGYWNYRVKKANGSYIRIYEMRNYSVDKLGKKWCNVAFIDSDSTKKRNGKTVNTSEKNKGFDKDLNIDEVSYDNLTGLLSREYALLRIQSYLDDNDKGTLIMFDLDDFNQINETRGHMTGDEVLKAAANIIKEEFAEIGIVSRSGGDEFMCYLPSNRDINIIEEHIKNVVNKIKSMVVNEADNISISVGAASVNDGIDSVDALVNVADTVVYDIKKTNKGTYDFCV